MKHTSGFIFYAGVSLRTWSMVGNLDREIALYHFLADHGLDISFVTYGDSTDLEYADPWVEFVYCATRPICRWNNSRDVSFLCTAVLSTPQTSSKQIRLMAANWRSGAARLLRKPLIARCGYMWSFNAALENGDNSLAAAEARRVEAKVFGAADRVVVTTNEMQQDILKRFPEIADVCWLFRTMWTLNCSSRRRDQTRMHAAVHWTNSPGKKP